MSTKLEKYLKEQRQSLDVEYPDDNAIWEKINERGLVTQQNSRAGEDKTFFLNAKLRRIAASVIIVLALSYIAIDLSVGISFNTKNYLSQLDSDYGRMEQEYLQTVKYKQRTVNNIDVPDNQIIRSIVDELEELDDLYEHTIDDLVELGDNQKAVNTIFNIYERKIELLERIIVETNKYENYEKNRDAEI